MYRLILLYMSLVLLELTFRWTPLFEVGDFEFSYSKLVLMGINIAFVTYIIFRGKIVRPNAGLFAYHAAIFISLLQPLLFYSGIVMGAASLTIQLMMQSMLIPVIYTMLSPDSLKKLIRWLVWFAFINCFLVYFSYFFPDLMVDFSEIHGYFGYTEATRPGYIRAFGIMGDSAPWFLSFFAILELQQRRYAKGLFFAGSSLLGASIGATFTLILAIAIMSYLNVTNKKLFLFNATVAIAMVLLVLVFAFPDFASQISIVKRLTDADTYSKYSGAQRLFTFSLALGMIANNPLFGHGYGTFMYKLIEVFDYKFFNFEFQLGALSNANNQFLQSIYEVGLLGFVLFVYMIWQILKIASKQTDWRQKQPPLFEFKKATFVWMLSFFIANQTAVYMIPSLLWTLICTIIGINILINRKYC